MRLVTFRRNNESRLGALLDKKVVDLQSAYQKYCHVINRPAAEENCFESMLDLLKTGDRALKLLEDMLPFAENSMAHGDKSAYRILFGLEEVALLAPLSNPGKIICIGGNFPAAGKLTAPDYPVIFLKPASSITGPEMPVRISEITANVAYEVELAVVIGRQAHRVSPGEAAYYIAGFTLANDLGDRLLEKRTSQWTSGKMFDSFTPLGPAIVTLDEMTDIHYLSMETWVNDRQVQKGNTADMFFSVEHLVSYLSNLTTLEPGDIVLTGSPKLMDGEPAPSIALKPGDTVRVCVGDLGELINPIQAEPR